MVGRVTQASLFRQLQAEVGRLQRDVGQVQQQVSSGKKLLDPSEDPAGAGRLTLFRSEIRELRAIRDNVGFGRAALGAEDAALDQATSILTRARELATSQASGTASAATRISASEEVAELERGLLNLANTAIGGRYVFGGLVSGDAPFDQLDDPGFDPTNPYSGPADPFSIRTDATHTVTLTTPGDQVFGDVILAIDNLRQALAAGSAPVTSLDEIPTATETLLAERASVGARLQRLSNREEEIDGASQTAIEGASAIEDADLAFSLSQLVQLQTALEATLASSRTIEVSILDFLQL